MSKPRYSPRGRKSSAASPSFMLTASQKWNALNGLGKFIMKILIGIPLIAGAAQAWLWLGWWYPASRQWVHEVQYPIQQTLQSIVTRGIQNRLSQIEGELLQAETARATAKTPAEQTKWALQAEKLRAERAELLQELKKSK